MERSSADYKGGLHTLPESLDQLSGFDDACKNGVCPSVVTIDDPGGYFAIAGFDIISNSVPMRTMIPQNPATADAINRSDAQVDARYADCSRRLGGSPAPSIEATKSILSTAILEGVSATLLAVTWNAESGFSSNPYSNPNDGSANNADVGPMQINYGTFNGWAPLAHLGNVFGTTSTGRQIFNGSEYDNLRAGARILNSYGGEGRTAAGRYRAGTGAFSRTPAGRAAFNSRAGRYDQWAGGYDAFFNCLRR